MFIDSLIVTTLAFAAIFAERLSHVNGRCPGAFDCHPDGDLKCVPLTAIRDCIADCPNAADERCGDDETLCDEHLKNGCGKCVANGLADRYCSDRRWKNLCAEEKHFKCLSTLNCVLPQWINDGNDDCGDGSDEGVCAVGSPDCESHVNETADIQNRFTFTHFISNEKQEGKCEHGKFQCRNGKECVAVHMVLDGTAQCSDNSDETYCEMPGAIMCDDPQRPCSFNPLISAFTCGCPIGCHRTEEGICRPITIPQYAGDCADLQMQYPKIRSGEYSIFDCSCANPRLCKISVFCDMEIYGGGWTVVMQRLNTSVAFEKSKEDYENGFRVDDGNFWIGLERMQGITARRPNELLLRLRTSTDHKTIIIRYSQVIVCQKSLDYQLNLGPLIFHSQFNMKDELATSRMAPFVTGTQLNCTTKEWGWWNCGCDPKGVLTAPNVAHDQYPGLRWEGQRLCAVQMLVRNLPYIPPLMPFVNKN